jgi:hypothetical protein
MSLTKELALLLRVLFRLRLASKNYVGADVALRLFTHPKKLPIQNSVLLSKAKGFAK